MLCPPPVVPLDDLLFNQLPATCWDGHLMVKRYYMRVMRVNLPIATRSSMQLTRQVVSRTSSLSVWLTRFRMGQKAASSLVAMCGKLPIGNAIAAAPLGTYGVTSIIMGP